MDQLAFNRFIANEAHLRGLSAGLKSDLDQIEALVDYYDFAVNEKCFEYAEGDALMSFIANGKPVLNAEYQYMLMNQRQGVSCAKSLWISDLAHSFCHSH